MKKFAFILLVIGFICLPAFTEVEFLSAADKELYTNFSNEVHNRKMKNLKDKVDFYDVSVDKTSCDKILARKIVLYLNNDELSDVIYQSPNGFYGAVRKASVYTGLGLTNVGYQTYSQNFSDFKITFSSPPKDYLIIKPEIISLNWLFDERGLIKSNMFVIANLAMQITIMDGDKQLFQKIYKINNSEVSLLEMRRAKELRAIGSNSVAPTAGITKALNLAFEKNIQDLFEILN